MTRPGGIISWRFVGGVGVEREESVENHGEIAQVGVSGAMSFLQGVTRIGLCVRAGERRCGGKHSGCSAEKAVPYAVHLVLTTVMSRG